MVLAVEMSVSRNMSALIVNVKAHHTQYIGMDVHDATISAAVKNAEGKLLMECVLETKAATILGGGHLGHRTPRAAAGFLCCPGGERDAAQHGSSHPGTEDCRHHFNHVEERSEFRPQTVAATSSLSIAEEAPSIRRVSSASGRSVSRDARFEGSISQ